jgi:hypothetical protein
MVISIWSSLREWRDWEFHAERLELIEKIDALLTSPVKTDVWIERGDTLSGV